jgi:hypothetical protein
MLRGILGQGVNGVNGVEVDLFRLGVRMTSELRPKWYFWKCML